MSRFARVVQNEEFALPRMGYRSFAISATSVSFSIDRVVRVLGTLAIAVIAQTDKRQITH